MPTGQGFNSKCGLGKESTWGTAVTIDTIVTFVDESFERAVQMLRNEYLDETVTWKSQRESAVTISNDMTLEAVYDEIAGDIIGVDDFFLGALGSATYTNPTFGNQFTPSATISESFTIAFQKQVSVWEINGGKVGQLEITGSAGSTVRMTASVMGKNLLRTGDAGISNATSDFDALANTTEPSLVAFDDLVFRMAIHGAALDSDDQLNITDFTITINNNLTDATFTTPLSGEDATLTLEPIRNGKREVTFNITFPRYTADTFLGYLNNQTALQADFKFTSPVGGKEINIYLPNIRVDTGNAPISGPEVFPLTITGVALFNGTTNTDMTFGDTTAITTEIGIETINARTAIP